jgi:hypothetical protein
VWHELHQILTQLRSLSQALQTIHLAQSSHTISHPPSHTIIAYYLSPYLTHNHRILSLTRPTSHTIIAYYLSPALPHTQSSHTISHPPYLIRNHRILSLTRPPSHAIIAYYISPALPHTQSSHTISHPPYQSQSSFCMLEPWVTSAMTFGSILNGPKLVSRILSLYLLLMHTLHSGTHCVSLFVLYS